jgi:hypothetical protein
MTTNVFDRYRALLVGVRPAFQLRGQPARRRLPKSARACWRVRAKALGGEDRLDLGNALGEVAVDDDVKYPDQWTSHRPISPCGRRRFAALFWAWVLTRTSNAAMSRGSSRPPSRPSPGHSRGIADAPKPTLHDRHQASSYRLSRRWRLCRNQIFGRRIVLKHQTLPKNRHALRKARRKLLRHAQIGR